MISLKDILRVIFSLVLLTSPGTTKGEGRKCYLYIYVKKSEWLRERHNADSKNVRNI